MFFFFFFFRPPLARDFLGLVRFSSYSRVRFSRVSFLVVDFARILVFFLVLVDPARRSRFGPRSYFTVC